MPSYGDWLTSHRPEFDWSAAHFRVMQGVLDGVTRGSIRRAYFSVPIRHGKTEHNTIGYAASRLHATPDLPILVVTYSQQQANKFSRQIRRLCRKIGVAISREVNGVSEWETAAGGGVRAVGVGTGTASVNAGLILVDDPIGKRDDAESQAIRDAVWDALTNDILARAEPHTAVLMTMSRWHQDDPAGRLLDRFAGHWHVTDLPGEAEPGDPLGRAVGAPLWPALRGAEWLEEKRRELLDYGFASLIQGRPRPREGGTFRWEWWKEIGAFPATGPVVRYWDLAGTRQRDGSHDPDYTAGALLGRTPDKLTVIGHVTRFRVTVAARDAMVVARARRDREIYGSRLVYWFERQAGVGGSEASDALLRSLQAEGIATYSEVATGSKLDRATPLASATMAGNVYLAPDDPEEPWHTAFKAEAADFGPSAKHDDQVDAAAAAFNKLSLAGEAGTFNFPRLR